MKLALALLTLMTLSQTALAAPKEQGKKVQMTSSARPIIMKWNFAGR